MKISRELEEKNQAEAQACRLLAEILSMGIALNEPTTPFKPFMQDFQTGGRSATFTDFTQRNLDALQILLDSLSEHELISSRIADLLWWRTKNWWPPELTDPEAAQGPLS